MNRKEQEYIAKEIIKEEKIIQNKNNSQQTIEKAQKRILKLILSQNLTLEDMQIIDDIVQKSFS